MRERQPSPLTRINRSLGTREALSQPITSGAHYKLITNPTNVSPAIGFNADAEFADSIKWRHKIAKSIQYSWLSQ